MKCTRELAETIAFGFSRLTVEHETGGWVGENCGVQGPMHGSDTPEADNLPDGFEDVDELILCGACGEKEWWPSG